MVMTPTSKQGMPGRDYGLAALLLLIAIVMSVVVTWYLASDNDASSTTTEVAPAVESLPAPATASEAEAPARGGLAEAWDAQASAATSEPIQVFVVSSEEASDRLQRAMADADAIRNSLGLPPFDARFVVLSQDADPWPMFEEEQIYRAAQGMQPIEVRDLRFETGETPDIAQAPVAAESTDLAPADVYTPYDVLP